MKNILFICSRNKWRSLTAETIYKNDSNYIVKSAGTENSARIKVNGKWILWAEIIFVMKKHKDRLIEKFSNEIHGKEIIVLDILDVYKFMDKELIEELKISVSQYI